VYLTRRTDAIGSWCGGFEVAAIRREKGSDARPTDLPIIMTMRDPHVAWLEYEIKTGWLFADPPPVNWETAVFQAKLDRGVLRANLREHFATEAEARAAVEPFLQTWEIDIALEHGGREITFAFKQLYVVDRDPPPPPPPGVITGMVATSQGRGSTWATGQVTLKAYPPAPSNFVAVPDVVTLWTRFEGFTKGREPLAAMAYFCFTVLKNSFGGRAGASKALAIDEDVLRKLSELSTNRGEAATARKMTRHLAPITATEARWLDAAVRALTRRVGEIAAGPSPPQLTMKQLPPL
jgi:hypothetical protein